MNIFGMGGMEILVILLIGFLVVGPSRMISMSRKMGKTFGDLRRSTSSLSDMVIEAEQEISKGMDMEGKAPEKHDPVAANTKGNSPSAIIDGDGPVPFQRGSQPREPEGKTPPSGQA